MEGDLRKFDNEFRKTDKADFMNTDEYLKMEGKEEGLAEGLAEGFAKGQAEERRNSVIALLANTKFPVAEIANILGISEAFVNKVKEGSESR